MTEFVYYWTGAAVLALIIGWLLWMVAYPFAAAISYSALWIYQSFKSHQWMKIKWHFLPIQFVQCWWSFLFDGIPYQISGKHFTWSGVFAWETRFDSAAIEQEKQG